jgi:EAL domain-containing protein (putative c-di-GMP-specific phosphodiesterase class I)
MLKIDQSFVRGLPGNANDVGIITAIIAMAHSLDLEVIAEGVENRAQA